jgi:hypothetical protein
MSDRLLAIFVSSLYEMKLALAQEEESQRAFHIRRKHETEDVVGVPERNKQRE